MRVGRGNVNLMLLTAINRLGSCELACQLDGIALMLQIVANLDAPAVAAFGRKCSLALQHVFQIWLGHGDAPARRQALKCLAVLCRREMRFPREIIADFGRADVMATLQQEMEDEALFEDLCLVLSRFAVQSKEIARFFMTESFISRILSTATTFSIGCFLFAFVCCGIPEQWVGLFETKTEALVVSDSEFNVKYGMKIGVLLGIENRIAMIDNVRFILGSAMKCQVIKWTLKLLLKTEEIPISVLTAVYLNLGKWGSGSVRLGLRLLASHSETFYGIVIEYGLAPLNECMAMCDRFVKVIGLGLLTELENQLGLMDLNILGNLLELVDDDECGSMAMGLLLRVKDRFVDTGKGAEFFAAVSEFEGLLSDLQCSENSSLADFSMLLLRSLEGQ